MWTMYIHLLYIFGSAILLEGNNSCVLRYVASLCERDMTMVAMGLLRVAILLLSSSGTLNSQRYVIFVVVSCSMYYVL